MANQLEHEQGCLREWLGMLNLDTMRCYPFASYKERWSCPACMVRKFGRNVAHIPNLIDEVVWAWEPPGRRLRQAAQRLGVGYFAMSLYATADRYVVAHPRLYPGHTTVEVRNGLVRALSMARDNGLTRLSFNDEWRPSTAGANVEVIKATGLTHSRIEAAFKKAGAKDGRIPSGSYDEFKFKVMQELEERVGFNFT